jgi:hypothetical protein
MTEEHEAQPASDNGDQRAEDAPPAEGEKKLSRAEQCGREWLAKHGPALRQIQWENVQETRRRLRELGHPKMADRL